MDVHPDIAANWSAYQMIEAGYLTYSELGTMDLDEFDRFCLAIRAIQESKRQ